LPAIASPLVAVIELANGDAVKAGVPCRLGTRDSERGLDSRLSFGR